MSRQLKVVLLLLTWVASVFTSALLALRIIAFRIADSLGSPMDWVYDTPVIAFAVSCGMLVATEILIAGYCGDRSTCLTACVVSCVSYVLCEVSGVSGVYLRCTILLCVSIQTLCFTPNDVDQVPPNL